MRTSILTLVVCGSLALAATAEAKNSNGSHGGNSPKPKNSGSSSSSMSSMSKKSHEKDHDKDSCKHDNDHCDKCDKHGCDKDCGPKEGGHGPVVVDPGPGGLHNGLNKVPGGLLVHEGITLTTPPSNPQGGKGFYPGMGS